MASAEKVEQEREPREGVERQYTLLVRNLRREWYQFTSEQDAVTKDQGDARGDHKSNQAAVRINSGRSSQDAVIVETE